MVDLAAASAALGGCCSLSYHRFYLPNDGNGLVTSVSSRGTHIAEIQGELVHQHFPLVSVIVVRYSRPRQRPRKIHFGIFARPNLIITPKQDSTEPLLVGGLV